MKLACGYYYLIIFIIIITGAKQFMLESPLVGLDIKTDYQR